MHIGSYDSVSRENVELTDELEMVVPHSRYCSRISLEGLRKTLKNDGHNSRCPDWDSIRASIKSKSESKIRYNTLQYNIRGEREEAIFNIQEVLARTNGLLSFHSDFSTYYENFGM
jgi:hypothetical protein